jgi:hypothetical protein
MEEAFAQAFQRTLSQAGDALERAGYDVQAYKMYLNTDHGYDHYTFGDTPEAAYDQFLTNLSTEEEGVQFYIPTERLVNGLRDTEQFDPARDIYRSVLGGIDVDEPTSDIEDLPAFGTYIRYIPDFPDDHFRVGTADTYAPYTHEDAEQRVNDIIAVLEDAGFDAEQATIN